MITTNFNLRGIDANIMAKLKKEAHKQDTSVNQLILRYIEQSIGHRHLAQPTTYHDLDHLAGTWQEEDAKTFKTNTRYFEKIDKDLW